MNNSLSSNVKYHVVQYVPSAPGLPQRKGISPGVSDCHQEKSQLKSVKGVSCVTQLLFANPVSNAPNAVPNLPVGARLQKFWESWLNLGAGPKVVQILKEGYTLPFRVQPKLTRSPTVISCYVNPQRNSYLLEALHQLIDKNAVEQVMNKTSLSFFNRLSELFQQTFPSPKTKQQVAPYSRPQPSEPISQDGEIQNGDARNHQNIPPRRGVGNLYRFQRRLLPHPNTRTIQEVSEVSCPGTDIPVQSVTFRPVNSTLRVHCSSKGGEADGHLRGYKDPPKPRRLVGTGQIPPSLSPAYPASSEDMSRFRLASKFGQVGAGTQANL